MSLNRAPNLETLAVPRHQGREAMAYLYVLRSAYIHYLTQLGHTSLTITTHFPTMLCLFTDT